MAINYVYPNPSVFGESCPVCGKKSWDVYKCDKCGKIFCKYCHPEFMAIDKESKDIEVKCECGSTSIFTDFL